PEDGMFADGILMGENQLCQPFADHHASGLDGLATLGPNWLVAFIEPSAALQRQPDRAEVAGRNNAPSGPRHRALPRYLTRRTGFDAHSRIAPLHGPMADRASRQHSGRGRQSLEE